MFRYICMYGYNCIYVCIFVQLLCILMQLCKEIVWFDLVFCFLFFCSNHMPIRSVCLLLCACILKTSRLGLLCYFMHVFNDISHMHSIFCFNVYAGVCVCAWMNDDDVQERERKSLKQIHADPVIS